MSIPEHCFSGHLVEIGVCLRDVDVCGGEALKIEALMSVWSRSAWFGAGSSGETDDGVATMYLGLCALACGCFR